MLTKLIQRLRREPDFIIGGVDDPYLLRWYLTKRLPDRCRLYLHKFVRDDDDRALHDHPAWSVSIILRGGYIEHLPGGIAKRRHPGMVVWRKAEQAHRVELFRGKRGRVIPAWTLFIFGAKTREWGFHCPAGWRHWREFMSRDHGEAVGKGCD
jgi:hypothetical protein